MNLTQLKQIINKNKSLIFIFGALLIEGLLILISLRIVKNYLTAQEYSDLTLYYSIISILSFGLFAGLEQTRQSNNSRKHCFNNTEIIAQNPGCIRLLLWCFITIANNMKYEIDETKHSERSFTDFTLHGV